MDIRKTMIIKETIEADGVGEACDPITRVVAIAVIRNPFAGRFVQDLSPLFDAGGNGAPTRRVTSRKTSSVAGSDSAVMSGTPGFTMPAFS